MKTRPLYSYLKNRRCAQCWGTVRDHQNDEGNWEIVCPRGCNPGGHVSAGFVEHMQSADILIASIVAENYPELDPNKMTPDEIARATSALYEED